MAAPQVLSPEVQARVCEDVARTGDLGEAARQSCVRIALIRRHQRNDPDFAQALKEAFDEFKDAVLIPELRRRAVDGVQRGVYHKGAPALDPESGQRIYERHYSDGLLLRLLEVLDPRFRPHSVQEVTPGPKAADIDDLSPEARRKLEEFLEQRAKDEAAPRQPKPDDGTPS